MVMGITGQDGPHLAWAQAHTASDHPHEAVRKGRLSQGQALACPGRVDPDHAESHDPMDDGVRARCVLDAKSPREETQDTRAGATAETRHAKELQG
jgi:hypothetical protein